MLEERLSLQNLSSQGHSAQTCRTKPTAKVAAFSQGVMTLPDSHRFLFLQGPPGPFFCQLGRALAARGVQVCRINLNGGDAHDWPADTGALRAGQDRADGPGRAFAYRGCPSRWPLFVEGFLRDHAITDLVRFGDCRPLHMAAHQMARLAGVRVHVFEEGYIRPNWLTLERDGVNGHSRLTRDPQALLVAAQGLPLPPDLPPIEASLGRRVRDTVAYFNAMWWGRLRFPFYRSHRPGSVAVEGIGWIVKYMLRRRTAARAEAALAALDGRYNFAGLASKGGYFLFPLQLSSDFQIRIHSPFSSMRQAADYVLASFAAHAPGDVALVIKDHPLDASLPGWRRYVDRQAARLGLAGRLIHLAGGDLQELAAKALGVVVVNSTSATFALASGVPVMALGTAIYALPGLTHQGPLAGFWPAPQVPDAELWDAFTRVLHRHCLIRGGLASEEAMRILIGNAVGRLLGYGGLGLASS